MFAHLHLYLLLVLVALCVELGDLGLELELLLLGGRERGALSLHLWPQTVSFFLILKDVRR